MSQTPKLAIVGLSREQIRKQVSSINDWYGCFEGTKRIDIVDTDDPLVINYKVLAHSTVEKMEQLLEDDNLLSEFISSLQYQKHKISIIDNYEREERGGSSKNPRRKYPTNYTPPKKRHRKNK